MRDGEFQFVRFFTTSRPSVSKLKIFPIYNCETICRTKGGSTVFKCLAILDGAKSNVAFTVIFKFK
jgi:hypothetical protein